jgi:hypothetical protein
VQKDEILKPEVSKVTVVHSQKKIENVTDKEKTKASSSPLKKKRKRPEMPPPLSENGNKVLFYNPNVIFFVKEHFCVNFSKEHRIFLAVDIRGAQVLRWTTLIGGSPWIGT